MGEEVGGEEGRNYQVVGSRINLNMQVNALDGEAVCRHFNHRNRGSFLRHFLNKRCGYTSSQLATNICMYMSI